MVELTIRPAFSPRVQAEPRVCIYIGKHCINIARPRGVAAIQALVSKNNLPMRQFFEKFGVIRKHTEDPTEYLYNLELDPFANA